MLESDSSGMVINRWRYVENWVLSCIINKWNRYSELSPLTGVRTCLPSPSESARCCMLGYEYDVAEESSSEAESVLTRRYLLVCRLSVRSISGSGTNGSGLEGGRTGMTRECEGK